MQQLFAIGIPTVNRADLLNETLQKYVVDFPDTKIIIIDNGNQQLFTHKNIKVFEQQENMGFTRSADMLMEYMFMKGFKWANVINDDIYWGKKQDEVTEFLTIRDTERLIPDMFVTNYNWCNILMCKEAYDKVGRWDYSFFNYFSDNDYSRRIRLMNMTITQSRFMNPEIYRESMSIKKDPALNATQFDADKRYYLAKWGGLPPDEKFIHPWNNPKSSYKL